jgi:hypothetical protein
MDTILIYTSTTHSYRTPYDRLEQWPLHSRLDPRKPSMAQYVGKEVASTPYNALLLILAVTLYILVDFFWTESQLTGETGRQVDTRSR